MKIREFYKNIQGDYDGTLARMMKEERIAKYLGKFKDTDDYQNMLKALETGNIEEIFRFSHNLKGVSLNLGLSKLAESSSAFCELFRNGAPGIDYNELLEEVKKDYQDVLDNLKEIEL